MYFLDGFLIFLFRYLKFKYPSICLVLHFSSWIGQVVRPLTYERCLVTLSPQSTPRTIQWSVGVIGSRRITMEKLSRVPKIYSDRPKIGLPPLHILYVQFPSALYLRLGEKCCAWSITPCPESMVASCYSRWSLGFSSQALRSPTRSFYTPFGPHSNACLIHLIVGRPLVSTYAPTHYHCFRPDVIIKLTTFGPKVRTPSTPHSSASLQTMATPPRCLIYDSVAHTV